MPATATWDSHYCTCLGHLGHCDRDRIISIGQGEKIRRVKACDIAFNFVLNITNVNMTLLKMILKTFHNIFLENWCLQNKIINFNIFTENQRKTKSHRNLSVFLQK